MTLPLKAFSARYTCFPGNWFFLRESLPLGIQALELLCSLASALAPSGFVRETVVLLFCFDF